MKAFVHFQGRKFDIEDHTVESAFVRLYTSNDVVEITFDDEDTNAKFCELTNSASEKKKEEFSDLAEELIERASKDFRKYLNKHLVNLVRWSGRKF